MHRAAIIRGLSFLALIGFIGIIGCSTTYQSEGFTGGYIDTPLGGGRYEIYVKANAMTSSTKTMQIAMVRAAEIALQDGDGWFVVLDADGGEHVSTYSTYNNANEAYQTNSSSTPRQTIRIQLIDAENAAEQKALNSNAIIERYGDSVGYKH